MDPTFHAGTLLCAECIVRKTQAKHDSEWVANRQLTKLVDKIAVEIIGGETIETGSIF